MLMQSDCRYILDRTLIVGHPILKMSGSEVVLFEKVGKVCIIKFNRPNARNAVNGEVARQMEAALDRFEADPDLWY